KTRQGYLGHIKRFLLFIGKDQSKVTTEDIRNYLVHLMIDKKHSHSFVNQSISAIKL
ncbi:integrase, partial [Dehalobacter sp. 14DCB1]